MLWSGLFDFHSFSLDKQRLRSVWCHLVIVACTLKPSPTPPLADKPTPWAGELWTEFTLQVAQVVTVFSKSAKINFNLRKLYLKYWKTGWMGYLTKTWLCITTSSSTLTCNHEDVYWGSPPFSAADLGWLLDLDLDPLLEAGVPLLDLDLDLDLDRDRDLDLDRDLDRDWDLALVFLVLGERDLDLE